MKKIKLIAISLALVLAVTGCGGIGTTEESSDAETSEVTAKTIPQMTVPIATTEAPSSEEPTTGGVPSDVDLSKVIALTFDDGPSTNTPSSTSRIIDVLEEYDCKATFFVQGINLTYAEFKDRNCEIVKREVETGMQVGSHSYDHPNFNKLSDSEIQEQIDKSIQLIKDATGGYEPTIIRTPYGAEKDNVKNAVDMPIILWDIDTMDWDTKDAQNTYNVVMSEIKGGDIVLMHDIYQATADAVEMIVPALVEQGYKLVTIDELFRLYGKELEGHTSYYNAR